MQERICVIGGSNIDICGASLEPLRNFDSNPGVINVSFGGVGRNIAQILSLLGEKPMFVSVFSSDSYGRTMKADCEALGMDTSFSIVSNDYPSSMYIAILDSNHDMRVAMSDMRNLREMKPEHLKPVLSGLTKNDMIVIDANLELECIHYVAENAPCALAADPVSASKCHRLQDVLSSLAIFKPNVFEAQQLNGIEIVDEESAVQSLDWFLAKGVKEIIISMAEQGVLLGTEKEKVWFTHRLIDLDNATGGGDSFLGAYLTRRLHGTEPRQAVRSAISAAVMTIEQDAVNRRRLCLNDIAEAEASMEIREVNLC